MVQEKGFGFGVARLREFDQALKLGVGSNRHRAALCAEFRGPRPIILRTKGSLANARDGPGKGQKTVFGTNGSRHSQSRRELCL